MKRKIELNLSEKSNLSHKPLLTIEDRQRALIAAAAHSNFDLVAQLLDSEALDSSLSGDLVPCIADDVHKVILAAIGMRQFLMAHFLIGHRLTKPDVNNNELLISAVSMGATELVEALLAHPEVDPSARNHEALCSAAQRGHLPIVKLLLKDKRVDANARINTYKIQTPIRQALINRHLDVVIELVEKGGVDLTLYPELIAEICQSKPQEEDLKIVQYLVNDGRVDLYHNNYAALEGAVRLNNLPMFQYLATVMTLDSLELNTKAICKAMSLGLYEMTALLLTHCEFLVPEIINHLPSLLQACYEPHNDGLMVRDRERKHLKVLKALVCDSRIIAAKSYEEWTNLFHAQTFRNPNEVSRLLLPILWNQTRDFHFFTYPKICQNRDEQAELPLEITNLIYTKML